MEDLVFEADRILPKLALLSFRNDILSKCDTVLGGTKSSYCLFLDRIDLFFLGFRKPSVGQHINVRVPGGSANFIDTALARNGFVCTRKLGFASNTTFSIISATTSEDCQSFEKQL